MEGKAEMTIFMKVTRDEYELPVAVADSNESAGIVGVSVGQMERL